MADVLYRGHNYAFRVAVKTSREWKVPPRQMLLSEPVDWDLKDSKLSMALTILEEETCKECGTPAWIGHSTDHRIVFDYAKAHCYGCMELEKKRGEESKGKRNDHGAKPYVKAKMWGGFGELPSRRQEYERRHGA